MTKAQKWTDEEVAEILQLVDEKGQAAALKEFSLKCGRSTDAIRRKLNHIRKEQVEAGVSDPVVAEPEVTVSGDGDVVVENKQIGTFETGSLETELLPESDSTEMLPESDGASNEPSAFRKIINWLLGR